VLKMLEQSCSLQHNWNQTSTTVDIGIKVQLLNWVPSSVLPCAKQSLHSLKDLEELQN
jgi:hypothetical protein